MKKTIYVTVKLELEGDKITEDKTDNVVFNASFSLPANYVRGVELTGTEIRGWSDHEGDCFG